MYFRRYSWEKGVRTLIEVAKELPEILFIFAGTGILEGELDGIENIINLGFQTGDTLKNLICNAKFSICPSEWYENCPFSVMESLLYGTPVLGANIGGIPELIEDHVTGELFSSGNREELKTRIKKLWEDKALEERYRENCKNVRFNTIKEYTDKLIKIYEGI